MRLYNISYLVLPVSCMHTIQITVAKGGGCQKHLRLVITCLRGALVKYCNKTNEKLASKGPGYARACCTCTMSTMHLHAMAHCSVYMHPTRLVHEAPTFLQSLLLSRGLL